MRRAPALLATLVLASALAGAPAAVAAGPPGTLQVKSVGTAYAGSHADVAAVVAAGTAASYAVKVVNPGATAAEYRLRIAESPAATVAASVSGGLFGKSLVAGPDGYAITGVPAHGATVVTVKVTPPRTSPQQTFTGLVTLADVDGTVLDDVTLLTEIKAPAKGTTPYSLFVSAGGGAAVGGDVSGQTVTGPSLKAQQSTKFTIKVRNDGPVAATVRLTFDAVCSAYWYGPIRDPLGRDVTLEVAGGDYDIALAAGGSKTFTLAINRVNAALPTCPDLGGVFSTTAPGLFSPPQVSAAVRVHPAVS
jgi:hypothetical protein